MKLHTAGEDYLEAVLILQKKLGMVRSVDVARYMEVSKPSVCYAVGTLREGGFLTTDENHQQLISIGVNPETAEVDACRIEHDISAETFERLKEFVKKNKYSMQLGVYNVWNKYI